MRQLCKLFAVSLVLAGSPAFAQPERYQNLEISTADTLVLAPDPRLELGPEGTIEMWVSASAFQPAENSGRAGQEVCILQSGDKDSGIAFRIAILPNGAGLAIDRGGVAPRALSSFPILGQGDVHIAFVTAGTGTVVLVNGAAGGSDSLGVPTAIANFQYLPPLPTGRSLHLGCDGTVPTAQVWLRTLRFWDRAMSQDELNWAGGFSGFPDGRPEVTRHLMAYSMFTNQRTEIRFTGPKIEFTNSIGSSGDAFFLRRPPTQQLAAIYVPTAIATGKGGFANLQLEFDDPTRDLALTGDATKPHSMPTVVGVKPTAVNWIPAAFLRDLLEPLEIRRDNPAALPKYQKAFETARAAARNALLGFTDDQDGVAFPDRQSTLRFDIAAGDRFRRITGVTDGQFVTSLRFDGTELASGLRGGDPLLRSNLAVGSQTFSLPLPPGAQFEGIAGRMSKGWVSSLAVAYSYPDGQKDGALSFADTRALWIDQDEAPPRREEDSEPQDKGGPKLIRGNYSGQRGYRIQVDPLKDRLTITIVEPTSKNVAPETFTFGHTGANRWAVNNAQRQRELSIENGKIHWVGADSLMERTLIPAPAYEIPTSDKLAWGATFSLEQRPAMVEANFKGYFPYAMRAHDFQATTGVDKFIFAMPSDSSQDYTTTGSHIIVPYGLYFRLDNKGFEQDDTSIESSAVERQFAWNANLGASVGIPGIFSFSEDVDYQTSQDVMASSKSSSTLTRSIATHYALVMDLARMRLAPEFEERIFEMRDRYLMNLPRDWEAFYRAFGTQYPYAVTYGGMAWLESYTDKSDVNAKDSEAMNVKAEAKGLFEGLLEVGAKVGGGYKKGSSQGGGTEHNVTIFGTSGGSFSRGGGWSLSRGEEVPILLDLRPLHQLFSPAFFTDALIWTDLRSEAIKAYDDFVRKLAKGTEKAHQWDSLRLDPDKWNPGN